MTEVEEKEKEIHRLRQWIERLSEYHSTIPPVLDDMILKALEGRTVEEYESE